MLNEQQDGRFSTEKMCYDKWESVQYVFFFKKSINIKIKSNI